jgi:hypothetical protein
MSIVLFGAFDRHNLGDLLLPHVAAALLAGPEPVFAGLASRDLRRYGGHAVRALAEVAAAPGAPAAALVHVGGEILTCSAWQAAVMLLPPAQVQPTVAYLEARPQERADWVRRTLGTAALAPYAASRQRLPGVGRVVHAGVGGADLAACEPALRDEVLATLRDADLVRVRDRPTLAQLSAADIPARLMPDPAVMVAELFGERIRRRSRLGAVAALRRRFARGYLAVQFGAEFADDATLAALAGELARVAAARGLGIVLFRAGAAPWHDDPASLQRVAARLPAHRVQVFASLSVWDLCALVASSSGYCGSSLHGRIVAMAFARPRVNLCRPGVTPGADKVAAFVGTWDDPALPALVDAARVAPAIEAALAADSALLCERAAMLATACRAGFDDIRRSLG